MASTRRLRVNYPSNIEVKTKKTNRTYKYDMDRDRGYLEVMDEDLSELLSMSFTNGETARLPYFSL